MSRLLLSRRSLLKASLASAALPLAGCDGLDGLTERDNALREFMASANGLAYRAQRLLLSADQLAPEFTAADIRQDQRPNGSLVPETEDYIDLYTNQFQGYRLEVAGLVERPLRLSLDDIRAMPSRTQITRHDCVEGWSCIAKWQGVPLTDVLAMAGLKPDARYVVFRCFDSLGGGFERSEQYYESIDLADAHHPQTILAYAMNGEALPVYNGAPLRLRVERQLGYKMAKFIRRIEAVASFDGIGRGQGSYWADRGYDWYAGI